MGATTPVECQGERHAVLRDRAGAVRWHAHHLPGKNLSASGIDRPHAKTGGRRAAGIWSRAWPLRLLAPAAAFALHAWAKLGSAEIEDMWRTTLMPRLSAAPMSTLSNPAQRIAMHRVPPSASSSSTCYPPQPSSGRSRQAVRPLTPCPFAHEAAVQARHWRCRCFIPRSLMHSTGCWSSAP